MRGHVDDVFDLAWAPDSRHLVSASIDHTAVVWNVPERTRVQTLRERDLGVLVADLPFARGDAVGRDPVGRVRVVRPGVPDDRGRDAAVRVDAAADLPFGRVEQSLRFDVWRMELARYATGRHKTLSMWDSFHGASLDCYVTHAHNLAGVVQNQLSAPVAALTCQARTAAPMGAPLRQNH